MRNSFFALALLVAACGSDGSNDEPTLGSDADLTGMPCEVKTILDSKCGTCHGDTPSGGAPVSLSELSAFQGKALNGEAMYKRVLERLADTKAPMPPVSREQLSEAEKKTLGDWLNAKAPASEQTCNDDKSTPDAGALPDTVPDSECEVIIELRAHQSQTLDDATGYTPPSADDHYECFHFPVPWLNKMQVLKIEPLIGDQRVLHHFLLYQDPKKVAEDGAHEKCLGVHPDASLLTGWAPGGQPVSLPSDVGLQVAQGPEAQFNLEIHYNNQARYPDIKDNSGVRICATSKLRKNEASSHWLGSELILLPPGQQTDVQSWCQPQKEAHIISVSPHMHKLGRHMKTIITRKDGTLETLNDRPFDFNDQQIYPVGGAAREVVVGPGDMLTTTCTFQNEGTNFVRFGESTNMEMCYNFVVAWPAGSLDTGGTLLEGPNRCQK
ncbi:MAG: hypothetical protein ABW352_00550 [Polyangiales bacterium]